MKNKHFTKLLLVFFLSVTGCNLRGAATNDHSIKAVSSKLKIESSSENVDIFLSKNNIFSPTYELDNCFNITPDFIADYSDYSIFKYSISTASFLLFKDEVYPLGLFGGLTSVALGDLDKDAQYELYFTFSGGSGVHRSQIGYFNPTTKKTRIFEYSYFDHDLILTINKTENSLFVYEATTTHDSQVDFTVRAHSNMKIANIIWDKEIKLNVIDGGNKNTN